MMLRRLVVVGTVLVVGAAAPTAIADVPAYAYKLVLKGTGSQDVTMTGSIPQDTLHQSASWNSQPRQVTVWLPKFNGPPGQKNAGSKQYVTGETLPQLGNVTQSGTYPQAQQDGSIAAVPYSCPTAPVTFSGDVINRVTVTPLDPTIELETDYDGSFLAGGARTFGPCSDGGNYARFDYSWNDPQGQRLQVGMLIKNIQIGDETIGGPAVDYTNVTTTQSDGGWTTLNCESGHGSCKIKFQMGGEYELKLVCKGTIGAAGGKCGGSNSGSGGKGGNGGGKNKSRCVVPKLAGKTVAAAKRMLERAGCALGKVESRKSRKQPKGHVISSNPAAGTTHKFGSPVKVVVSSGP